VSNISPLPTQPGQIIVKKLIKARANVHPPLTMAALARETGYEYHQVKYWHYTGNIPIEALGVLSDALEVDMDYWDWRV
jgi:hypothetical protein